MITQVVKGMDSWVQVYLLGLEAASTTSGYEGATDFVLSFRNCRQYPETTARMTDRVRYM